MQDDRVSHRDVRDRRPDLGHPAGVLVAERVRQADAGAAVPLALDDVQVGAAHAGAADLHDHVQRSGDGGLRDLFDDDVLVVAVQADSSHSSSPRPDVG